MVWIAVSASLPVYSRLRPGNSGCLIRLTACLPGCSARHRRPADTFVYLQNFPICCKKPSIMPDRLYAKNFYSESLSDNRLQVFRTIIETDDFFTRVKTLRVGFSAYPTDNLHRFVSVLWISLREICLSIVPVGQAVYTSKCRPATVIKSEPFILYRTPYR